LNLNIDAWETLGNGTGTTSPTVSALVWTAAELNGSNVSAFSAPVDSNIYLASASEVRTGAIIDEKTRRTLKLRASNPENADLLALAARPLHELSDAEADRLYGFLGGEPKGARRRI
jgi:hypothetical protein